MSPVLVRRWHGRISSLASACLCLPRARNKFWICGGQMFCSGDRGLFFSWVSWSGPYPLGGICSPRGEYFPCSVCRVAPVASQITLPVTLLLPLLLLSLGQEALPPLIAIVLPSSRNIVCVPATCRWSTSGALPMSVAPQFCFPMQPSGLWWTFHCSNTKYCEWTRKAWWSVKVDGLDS